MARICTSDPLEKFRFLVDFSLPTGGTPVRTGFHDVQIPKRTTNKILYREGKDADISGISAGLNTMEDIVLSRGVIGTEGTAANDLLNWIKTVHKPTTGSTGVNASSGPNGTQTYRGEVTIKMLDRDGTIVRAWKVYEAFPVNFVPASDLNAAEDGEKSMESLTLTYEDFQELKVTSGTISTSLTD